MLCPDKRAVGVAAAGCGAAVGLVSNHCLRWRLIVAVCLPFALGAGWGLTGPLDGEGLFGALRVYAAASEHWNYNGGLYH